MTGQDQDSLARRLAEAAAARSVAFPIPQDVITASLQPFRDPQTLPIAFEAEVHTLEGPLLDLMSAVVNSYRAGHGSTDEEKHNLLTGVIMMHAITRNSGGEELTEDEAQTLQRAILEGASEIEQLNQQTMAQFGDLFGPEWTDFNQNLLRQTFFGAMLKRVYTSLMNPVSTPEPHLEEAFRHAKLRDNDEFQMGVALAYLAFRRVENLH